MCALGRHINIHTPVDSSGIVAAGLLIGLESFSKRPCFDKALTDIYSYLQVASTRIDRFQCNSSHAET